MSCHMQYHYEHARPANRGQPLQKIMAAVCTIPSEHIVVFITEAHLVGRKNLLYITEARIWPASWRYVLHALDRS
jgi:hypothetical protein